MTLCRRRAGILIVALLVAAPACKRAASSTTRLSSGATRTCGDLATFRAAALREAPSSDRAALQRWAPPRPVAAADRAAVGRVLRRYVAECGLAEVVPLAQRLVRFRTISAHEAPATGPAFRALAAFLAGWAKRAGLGWRIFGKNDAWEVVLGSGARRLGFVFHADVQPVGSRVTARGGLPAGWTQPPFAGRVVRGRLYGRGSEDDKGPIAAGLVVLRLLARAGLTPPGEVLAIMGTGEESDWKGMIRYAKERPQPRYTISVDASFPVVVAEAGFVAWHLAVPRSLGGAPGALASIVSLRGGEMLTQVPGTATMTLRPGRGEAPGALLARVRREAAAELRGRGAATGHFGIEARLQGGKVRVAASGKAIHSSVAWRGHNALWVLASLAQRLRLAPGGAQAMLRLIARYFDRDLHGKRLGLAYADPRMGKLLVVPTLLRAGDREVTLSINMRRPPGMSAPQFGARLDAALRRLRADGNPRLREFKKRYVGEPAIADTSGPLVRTLMDIYRRYTGDRKGKLETMYGGTYARLFRGAVNFGPSLPGRPYLGHAPDEYLDLDALRLTTRMLLEAALRLGY